MSDKLHRTRLYKGKFISFAFKRQVPRSMIQRCNLRDCCNRNFLTHQSAKEETIFPDKESIFNFIVVHWITRPSVEVGNCRLRQVVSLSSPQEDRKSGGAGDMGITSIVPW